MTGEIIALNSLRRLSAPSRAQPGGCGTGGGCGSGDKADIGSGPSGSACSGGAGIPGEIWAKIKDHPCYNEDAHHDFARIHVAVAPACNIQCNYCNRKYDCSNESRPGVVSEKLTPEQALRKVTHVAQRLPQLSVVGIAGPGDALANPKHTFRTFDLIQKALPHLKLCLSTNGLALPDHVQAIKDFGIDHVTITINAVEPEVGEKLYPWIFFEYRRWTGREAAQILFERQMEGLEALTAAGVLVKVNSVLVPGINDQHLDQVNAAVRSRGAFLHNVMPLISDPAHGTAFGLSGQRGPTPQELTAVQERLAGTGARLMRHCRQCRADAVGLLGDTLDHEFSMDTIPEQTVLDPLPAQAYRAHIEREWQDRDQARAAAVCTVSAAADETTGDPSRARLRVAVATKGGGRINLHFGHAREFLVYEADGSGIRLLGPRRVDQYCQGGYGEEVPLDGIVSALADVDLILVARIGDCPRERLTSAGLRVIDAHAYDYIEPAIAACFAAEFGSVAAPVRAVSA